MFVAIDIGNSNLTVGLKQNNSWQEFRISTKEIQPSIFYTNQLQAIISKFKNDKVEGVVISSVVPHLTKIVLDATRITLFKKPIVFEQKWYPILPITSLNNEEIGTDLFANALAAYSKYSHPCLIVDFGTALTYTLVNREKIIEGVAIAPGIQTAMQALSSNAAQLPEIPLELPNSPLGINTVEAMNSGILWGFVGQVTYMMDKIIQGKGYKITTIATGGLSEVLKPLKNKFDVIDKNLTVEGLYYFFRLWQADQDAKNAG